MSSRVVFKSERPTQSAVTAVVSLYNYADCVEGALESLRDQTEIDLDLVIVDDASIDHSASIAETWLRRHSQRFGRALLIRHERNGGPAAARNTAIAEARTEYVFFLDADDRIYPPCIERLRRALTWSDASFSYPYLACRGAESRLMNLEPWSSERLRRGNCVCVTALVRRAVLETLGGFDAHREIQGWEDYDLWVRIGQAGGAAVLVPEVLGEYWVHSGSVTTDAQDRVPEMIEYMLTKHPRFFFPAVALAPIAAAPKARLDYHIDSIREAAEFVEVRGWALAAGRCGKIALSLDARGTVGARSYATMIQSRTDLVAHFGPEALNGGFLIYLSRADLKPNATPFHLLFDTGQRVLAAPNAGTIRLAARRRRPASAEPGATILMYHRVTDIEDDPFQIAIRPDCFARQVEYLRKNRNVVPLAELLQGLAAGTFAPGTVALTFDDGYADNFHNALPLLEEHGLPATFCIATGMIGRSREFWTDEVERIVAQAVRARCKLQLTIGGKSYDFDCAHERGDSLQALVRLLKLCPNLVRGRLLSKLAAQIGEAPMRETHRPLSRTELGALASSPVSAFAAHSLTHTVLASEDEERQREEIVGSRSLLERLTGKVVTVFCYPFGQRCDFTAATVRLVREAGYQAALTASPGAVQVGADPFVLPRLHVRDWTPAELARSLDKPPTISHWPG